MGTEKSLFEGVLNGELDLLEELRANEAQIDPSTGGDAIYRRVHKAHPQGWP